MTVRILLKSCAMPPVSWPTASIFSACRIRSSAAILSVRSRMKPLNTKPSRRLQRGDAQFDLDLLAVAPQRLESRGGGRGSRLRRCAGSARSAGLMRVAVRRPADDQFAELLAERFVARPAEDLFGLRIPVRDDALLVHLDEGVERGIDDAARQLLAFAQRFLRPPALGHVAADEEMPLDRFGPCAEPGQPYRASVLVDAARIGDLRTLARAAPRAFPRGQFSRWSGWMKSTAAAADHFLRPIAQDGFAARADLNQNAPGIHHQDQILRGLEDAAALLGLLPQRLPGLVAAR